MTELVATQAPVSSEVAHVLDDIFTLARIPFVHDFMFTADPVADISILTAPVQKEHAIAARITVSGTETSASYAHVFDFSCDFFFCSIPAFSVGAVTVGLATKEPARGPSHATLHTPPSAAGVQCNRYVRDDERGVFFVMSENPGTGITEVDCMSHRSTRRRTRVCARFHTETLRARLRSDRGVLHPDDLAAALTYLNVCYERRACPLCRADDPGECGCTLPFCRPAHPLDFRNERRNMRLHTGLYRGGSTVRLFNAEMPFVVTSLSTRSVIKGSLDERVISRLNKYAVQDRMSRLQLNPLATSICGAGARGGCGSEDGEVTIASGGRRREGGGGGGGDADAGLEGADDAVMLADASFLQDNGGFKSPSLSSFSLDVAGAGLVPLLAGPLGTGTTLVEALSGPGSDRSALSHSGAVAGDAGRIRGPHGGAGDERARGDLEIRAELRKQRNREAAARSNVKRKLRNEALRRDLAQVNARAAELRATEKTLREENVRLRSLATQRNFKLSAHLSHIQIARS